MAEGLDVRFASALGDDDLACCYRRAQVLALPSVHVTCYEQRVAISELLGLAAIEAMASGTPVVASRVGGLPEVVRDGETGYLVEPGDIDGLRDRLATVLADRTPRPPPRRQRVRPRARALHVGCVRAPLPRPTKNCRGDQDSGA